MTTTLPDYEPEEKEHRVDIEIGRPDISQTRIIETIQQPLVENQARLRVDKFGFSTNNITYAVVGEMLSYWDFFPAQPQGPDDTTGWGRVPVWGFATVVESRSDDVEVGERLFGYLPMSPELVITVGKANPHSVNDVSEHRAHLHNAYNSLRRCSTDPIYAEASEDLQMMLYPLFFTSFVIDDFLADNLDFGAEQIVISSASSKTSLGAAFLFKARGITTVGMTSEANRSFTEGLGLYDQVVTYDEIEQLNHVPSIYVDVAGNTKVLAGVHQRLAEVLAHSMTVGDTHWEEESSVPPSGLPGPKPAFLFAPTQIAKRTQDWGTEELNARVADAWFRFTSWVPSWLTLEHRDGAEAVRDLYVDVLANKIDPKVGYTCTMNDGEAS